MIVIKVGGSLFDLPDLGPRLQQWLDRLPTRRLLLIPGGGAVADLVRDWDRCHRIGEDQSHWMALVALSVTARFLAGLLVQAVVVPDVDVSATAWAEGRLPVLDLYRFALLDEGRPGCLPRNWAVTSDSFAARVARVAKAEELVLLKSVDIPAETDWILAGERGWVDEYFAQAVCGMASVRVINFRQWRP